MSVRLPPSSSARYQARNPAHQHLNLRAILGIPIADSVGTEVLIRLKWGQTEYKGTLESIDSYMNVLLRDTQEFIDGKATGALGLVLIRFIEILDPKDLSRRMSDSDVRLEDVLADHEATINSRARSSTQSSVKPDKSLSRTNSTSPTPRWKRLSNILAQPRRNS
ncbi:hypothetical protein PENCOP_c002G08074 [Penicillium coprophilum]|uniref:Sm protein F n=1 Tax=Penicillium coprophilum TaxID=36646 RepID=A0A1V6V2S6_9EURO|nr:hypothetical protein PENCOP_c002G08074 [Penicillium coprophilum]